MSDLRGSLERGIRELRLELPAAAGDALLAYLGLLQKWNKAYNLTAIRDPQQMVVRHLLDSLAVVPHLPAGSVIDVGTGAGLPGIPLALARPANRYVLLDSNGKKTRFLQQVKLELGLEQVEVINARAEDYRPATPFHTVITRAFAALPDMLDSSRHLLAPGGHFLAMKGTVPHTEMADLPVDCRVLETIRLTVPGLGAEQRHLVRIGCDA